MRTAVITAGICLSMIGSCFAQTPVVATARIETRIPPQALVSALRQFTKIDHIQVLYLTTDVGHLRTSGASGSLTADETLTHLLSGTGLTYRYVGTDVVSLISSSYSSPRTGGASPAIGSTLRSRKAPQTPSSQSNIRDMSAPGKSDPGAPVNNKDASNRQSPAALHEVVVTAQLYSQSAFDVPLSLDVITATQLDNLRVFDLSAVQYQVPGLYIQTGGGINRITLDGVGNGVGSGALVGEYIDDADVTGGGNTGSLGLGTGDIGLYDISRVEVLHGPQGTLYGDGSMGGVIRVITNRPDLQEMQFSSDVAAQFSQYGAPGQDIQAMLNIPIVTGTLGLRFAGTFAHDGGWIDEPEANVKNVNSTDLTDARIEALWRPSSGLSVTATQILRRDAYGVGYGEDAQGNISAPLPFGLTTTPQGTQALSLSNIGISYDINSLRLVSSSTYFTHSFSWSNVFVSPEVSTAYSEYILYRNQIYTTRDYSQELRLSNATGDAWQWMIGGFYKNYADTDTQNASLTYSIPAPPVINVSLLGFDTGETSTAAFVNTSYTFTPLLQVGAGVRYYRAHETYDEPLTNYHGYAGLGIIPAEFEKGEFSSTDPRLYLRYKITPHVNTYVTASKGFREGGFNGPGLPNYEPETLWRYDVGAKARFLSDALQSDLDLFYSDYTNYVVDGFFPAIDNYYQANVGTAHIKGIDASIGWRLSSDWRINANGEYVDARLVNISALDTGYTVGERVPWTTKYSFSTSIERDYQWNGRQGYTMLSYSEISPVQDSFPGYIYAIAASSVLRFLNFTSSIGLNANASVGIFARNLLNDRGYQNPNWIVGEGSRPQPRTFGVDFKETL